MVIAILIVVFAYCLGCSHSVAESSNHVRVSVASQHHHNFKLPAFYAGAACYYLDATSLNFSFEELGSLCRREGERQPMRKIPQMVMENRRCSHLLTRQQVMRLTGGYVGMGNATRHCTMVHLRSSCLTG